MKKVIPVLFVLLLAVGCDIASDDKDLQPSGNQKINLVTASGRSTVIDLQQVFPDYKSAFLPDQSDLQFINSRYVKYTEGNGTGNNFSFNVTKTDNSRIKSEVVTQNLSSGEGCSEYAPFTYAKITNDQVLVFNILNNPEFCGFDIFSPSELGVAGPRPGIDKAQNNDEVVLSVFADHIQGNAALFTYVPPAGFVGRVITKYYFHIGADHDAHGDLIYYDPQYSKYFSAHEVIIDVVAP